jgi:hypothetical protein
LASLESLWFRYGRQRPDETTMISGLFTTCQRSARSDRVISPVATVILGSRIFSVLQSPVRHSRRSATDRNELGLRFLPQDFHNCGKNCGKAGPPVELLRKEPIFIGSFEPTFRTLRDYLKDFRWTRASGIRS